MTRDLDFLVLACCDWNSATGPTWLATDCRAADCLALLLFSGLSLDHESLRTEPPAIAINRLVAASLVRLFTRKLLTLGPCTATTPAGSARLAKQPAQAAAIRSCLDVYRDRLPSADQARANLYLHLVQGALATRWRPTPRPHPAGLLPAHLDCLRTMQALAHQQLAVGHACTAPPALPLLPGGLTAPEQS